MERIAYVMEARLGSEGDLREAQSRMPTDELLGLGIRGMECFIGSGYYVLVFEAEGDDFQQTMKRFFDTPSVQGFLDKLRPHVEGLPPRGQAFAAGDEKHGGAATERRTASATVTSAELPLAASAFSWHAGGGNGSRAGSNGGAR